MRRLRGCTMAGMRCAGLVLPLCMMYSTVISLAVFASLEYALLSHRKVANAQHLISGCSSWALSEYDPELVASCAGSSCRIMDFICDGD